MKVTLAASIQYVYERNCVLKMSLTRGYKNQTVDDYFESLVPNLDRYPVFFLITLANVTAAMSKDIELGKKSSYYLPISMPTV